MVQSASGPRSPVRTRTTVSTGTDHTFRRPDLPGPRGPDDRVDDRVGLRVLDDDLDPDLGHQVDLVLGAPVDLGVPALTPVAAGLGDGQPVHTERLERGLDLVQLERLDDRR